MSYRHIKQKITHFSSFLQTCNAQEAHIHTVNLHNSQLEATFCTKFIKIREKNSVPTHGAYYVDYKLKVANSLCHKKQKKGYLSLGKKL